VTDPHSVCGGRRPIAVARTARKTSFTDPESRPGRRPERSSVPGVVKNDRMHRETRASDRTKHGWNPSLLSDEILEWAGVGVTILDPAGNVLYYNRWAEENLDREPEYLGRDVRDRHRRKITNPRFDAMLALFEEGRTAPVRYVARPYGKTTILVTVSPIIVDGRIAGYSQIVLLKDEVQELCRRFDESGRTSFEQEMLPYGT
jgi:transcriptional regulator with PAS, ATPase and Fis domain